MRSRSRRSGGLLVEFRLAGEGGFGAERARNSRKQRVRAAKWRARHQRQAAGRHVRTDSCKSMDLCSAHSPTRDDETARPSDAAVLSVAAAPPAVLASPVGGAPLEAAPCSPDILGSLYLHCAAHRFVLVIDWMVCRCFGR